MKTGFTQSVRALIALKPRQKLTAQYLFSLLIAVTLAFLVGAGIMLLCGYDPLACYAALFKGALGKPRAFGNTLAKTVTLCLTGLAMGISPAVVSWSHRASTFTCCCKASAHSASGGSKPSLKALCTCKSIVITVR